MVRNVTFLTREQTGRNREQLRFVLCVSSRRSDGDIVLSPFQRIAHSNWAIINLKMFYKWIRLILAIVYRFAKADCVSVAINRFSIAKSFCRLCLGSAERRRLPLSPTCFISLSGRSLGPGDRLCSRHTRHCVIQKTHMLIARPTHSHSASAQRVLFTEQKIG